MYVDRRPFDGHFQKGKREQSHNWEEEMELSSDGACEEQPRAKPADARHKMNFEVR